MNLSNDDPTDDLHSSSSSGSSTTTATESSQPSSFDEQEAPPTTNTTDTCPGTYCLIIFNNPSWSQRIRKQPRQEQAKQQQQTQGIKNEKEDMSVDDLFIGQLRQIIKTYMQHTKRPFPIKYFLDFTDQ